MAVVIRMKRTGRRNRPCYRISVADRSVPRDGCTLETLGLYDPASPMPDLRLKLNVERAKHWISVGALPSETVRSIFKREGVYGDSPPVKKVRRRPGRKKVTATRTRRDTLKQETAEAKVARHQGRVAVRRAAKKAAAAPAE